MRLRVQSLALLIGLGIRCCRELWCRSQTWLGSRVAVTLVQAGGYSSDSIPSLGTYICLGSGLRKWQKDKNKQTNKQTKNKQTKRINVNNNSYINSIIITEITFYQKRDYNLKIKNGPR